MIKLYLDEDVHKKIALALRLKGYDVVSAHEVKNRGLSDSEQLKYAVKHGRAIFTFNSGDFSKLHTEYIANKLHHYGILTAKQITFSELLGRLTGFLYNKKQGQVKGGLFWI